MTCTVSDMPSHPASPPLRGGRGGYLAGSTWVGPPLSPAAAGERARVRGRVHRPSRSRQRRSSAGDTPAGAHSSMASARTTPWRGAPARRAPRRARDPTRKRAPRTATASAPPAGTLRDGHGAPHRMHRRRRGARRGGMRAPVLPHQEPQRHEASCHVVVPAAPSAHVVVVEADLALGVLRTPLRRGGASMPPGRSP